MISIIMGKPGVGKSTFSAIICRDSIKKGIPVYSNVPIAGAYQLNIKEDLNKNEILEANIIIDEAGKEFQSRNYKQFNDDLYSFFCEHRHFKLNIYLFVQEWSRLDKVIRELVQRIYIVSPSILGYWCIKVKSVGVNIEISEDKQIVETFHWIPWFIGGTKYYYKRSVWHMFDTYERKKLNIKEFKLWSQYEVKKSYLKLLKNWALG